jgi:hypothetical protein
MSVTTHDIETEYSFRAPLLSVYNILLANLQLVRLQTSGRFVLLFFWSNELGVFLGCIERI